MKKGLQKEQFEKGVEYLKEALSRGIPVIVGVDDDSRKVNPDLTTEHFVTIVGMGEAEKGKYFLFYDNAVNYTDSDIGTSRENKLYCKPSEYLIEGIGAPENRYIQRTPKRKYIVTQIRESK